MPNTTSGNNPAITYTIPDFIAMKSQDELTYANFAIFDYKDGETFVEQSIVDFYINEIKSICIKVDSISVEEVAKYKYAPDLLSYDIYGTPSLDFIILICNGIIDPKEFDFKRKYIMLPKAKDLASLLSAIYNSEYNWLSINKKQVKEEKASDT